MPSWYSISTFTLCVAIVTKQLKTYQTPEVISVHIPAFMFTARILSKTDLSSEESSNFSENQKESVWLVSTKTVSIYKYVQINLSLNSNKFINSLSIQTIFIYLRFHKSWKREDETKYEYLHSDNNVAIRQ